MSGNGSSSSNAPGGNSFVNGNVFLTFHDHLFEKNTTGVELGCGVAYGADFLVEFFVCLIDAAVYMARRACRSEDCLSISSFHSRRECMKNHNLLLWRIRSIREDRDCFFYHPKFAPRINEKSKSTSSPGLSFLSLSFKVVHPQVLETP